MTPKMEKGTLLLRRYEIGCLLGQGTFAKVYKARSVLTGETVAIKTIDKGKALRVGMIDQIKREIAVMRLVRHPNVVQLFEVMATKSKIFFAMQFVRGGELFAKVAKGRLNEDIAREYFQQLIGAVDFCHSRGVYHRDLKPENLLLDDDGSLKVSDFGLSALHASRRQDGLLHTTCGTPAYVAPEVISRKGYDGAKADIWSCGVILFVLVAGFLPFNEPNLVTLYGRISRGEFKCPTWFSSDVRKLLYRLLDPNPNTRITMSELMTDNWWFRKGLKPVQPTLFLQLREEAGRLLDAGDVHGNGGFLTEDEEQEEVEEKRKQLVMSPIRPCSLNAFDIISRSQGFDLSGLFEEKGMKEEARFTTRKPAAAIVSKLKQIALSTKRFKVIKKNDGVVKLSGGKKGRKGQLDIEAKIFEVSPELLLVEMKKSSGDTLEYQKFYHRELRPSLKDIVWTWQVGDQSPPPQTLASSSLRPPPVPTRHSKNVCNHISK